MKFATIAAAAAAVATLASTTNAQYETYNTEYQYNTTATEAAASPISYAEYINQAALVAETESLESFQPLILGGTVVPSGTKTYVSGMRSTAAGTDFCGGTLIAPKFVLTAAHCYGSITYVSVGTHYLSGTSDGEQLKVVKQTKHPKNDASTNSYDFLILELERASKFAPIALAKADDSDIVVGSTATVLGWGTTTESGAQSKELLRVDVPLLDNTNCAKTLDIDATMVCAGGQANKDSCQGDSGGPLIVAKGGKDVLVGVVSWGEGCGRVNYPGVYARVSSVASWISSIATGTTFR